MAEEGVVQELSLKGTDPEVARAIEAEIEREQNTLVLIASENYASRAVMEAAASVSEVPVEE